MFKELDNQMILALDGTEVRFDTNFQSRDNRRIELDLFVGRDDKGDTVELVITARHIKGGLYSTHIHRRTRRGNFFEVRFPKDSYASHRQAGVGSRYSDKNLEKVALDHFNLFTENAEELRKMIQWAEELVA